MNPIAETPFQLNCLHILVLHRKISKVCPILQARYEFVITSLCCNHISNTSTYGTSPNK